MLEGLEVTIQSFKSLKSIIDYRIEAEYFDKRFLNIDSTLYRKPNVSFFDVADYENGRAFSSDQFSEIPIDGGIRVCKIGDVTQRRVNENWVWVSPTEFEKQKGKYLIDDDILMTLTGDPPDVGKVNLFRDNSIKSTWNQRVARIFLKDTQNHFINAKVLYITLANRYCREQLERYAKGIRQRNLGTECIDKLKLPVLSRDFQMILDSLVSNSFSRIENSREIYKKAESILFECVGINHRELSDYNINIKRFKESYNSTQRLDAEFYLPKYDDLEYLIKQQRFTLLKDIRSDNFRGLQPIYFEDGDLDVINSKHILEMFLDYENFEKTKSEYWNLQTKARVFKGDILTYTTGANIGRTQVYLKDEKAIASNHVNIIRLKSGNPIYIAFVLNSKLGRLQTEKRSAGSAQAELYPKDLDDFLIPLIEPNKQDAISELVKESFKLHSESKSLLEMAKYAVEMAIEIDEATATKFIKDNKI